MLVFPLCCLTGKVLHVQQFWKAFASETGTVSENKTSLVEIVIRM